MRRKGIIKLVVLLSVIRHLLTCQRRDFISREQIEEYPPSPIYMVITVEDKVFEFEPGAILEDGLIKGTLRDGTYVEIEIARVKKAYAQRFDESRAGTFCCVGAGSALLVALPIFVAIVGTAVSDSSGAIDSIQREDSQSCYSLYASL